MTQLIQELINLTPVNVRWVNNSPLIEWCNFENLVFTDPFFIHTYFRLQEQQPNLRTIETSAETLKFIIKDGLGLEPSGFIFHTSRCGSTLISRLLAQSELVLSLGEPDPILGMLEYPETICNAQIAQWLKELILVLGRPRRPSEDYYVIKFTSYHLFHLPLIQKAFPEVPCLFVYREPVEVIASVLNKPTGFFRMKTNPTEAYRWTGINETLLTAMSDVEYLAFFLSKMYNFITEQILANSNKIMLVNYQHLPQSIWNGIDKFFKIALTDESKRLMIEFSHIYSKDRSSTRSFDRLSQFKKLDSENDNQIKIAVEKWAFESYTRLCEIEKQQQNYF